MKAITKVSVPHPTMPTMRLHPNHNKGGDPFRRLFLDQVERIIRKEPSREMLLALLQLASPELESLGYGAGTDTEKLFKELMRRVHPDKHTQDNARATSLCQEARVFYDRCLGSPPTRERKRLTHSPSNAGFPLEYNAIEKWPHMEYDQPCTQPEMEEDEMSRSVAYQCINARGAIAHGRQIERCYGVGNVSGSVAKRSAEQVFERFGGTREVFGADEIKEELMLHGPVVSNNFRPSELFLNEYEIGRSEHCHQSAILIVGWKQLSSGEVWIVQPLFSESGVASQVAHVGIGQFGIDECCLAPAESLEDVPWQQGPYYDGSVAGVEEEWLGWTGTIDFKVDSMMELDSLFQEIGTTFFANPSGEKHVVTVRNKRKIAHSRTAYLSSTTWLPEKHHFVLSFNFI